jgi:peroxiredoxin
MALASAFTVSGTLLASSTTPRQAPEIAWTVPGQGQQTLRQYLGKVVALEFVYTTCKQCLPSAQALENLQLELGGQGFQAVEVAFNPNASVLAERFIADQHLSVPVGWTFGEQVSSFLGYGPADRFVVPQIVVIDRTGVIRYQTGVQGHDDLRSEPVLRQKITELLRTVTPSTKSPNAANRRR